MPRESGHIFMDEDEPIASRSPESGLEFPAGLAEANLLLPLGDVQPDEAGDENCEVQLADDGLEGRCDLC